MYRAIGAGLVLAIWGCALCRGGQAGASGAGAPQPTPAHQRVATDFCSVPGLLDETCVQNALANDVAVFVPAGVYRLRRPIVAVGLRDATIEGSGAATVLSGTGPVFVCDGCEGVTLEDIGVQSPLRPAAVRPSALPTGDPGAAILVDRWGTGRGYIPTVNDTDLWKKLSAFQRAESFDAEIVFRGSAAVRITHVVGYLASLILYDTSYSSIDHNEFSAGKNFAGGIVLWRGTEDSPGCRFDVVVRNRVSYAAFSGIFVGGADHVLVSHNEVDHSGESGIKTGQSPSYERSRHIVVEENVVRYAWSDGLDLSSAYPHTDVFDAASVAAYNVSEFNNRTGLYVDGRHWLIFGNTFRWNGMDGMFMDLSDSSVSFNDVLDNNTAAGAETNQITLNAGGGDTVVGNVVGDDAGLPGYGIFVSGGGTLVRANWLRGARIWAAGPARVVGNYYDGRPDGPAE